MQAPELSPNSGWINTDEPLWLHGAGAALAGRVVLLEFWSPGRVACEDVLRELAWFEEKYGDEPFEIVGVCSPETQAEESVERMTHEVRRRRVTHPVVIDRGFRVWRAYGVTEWPTMVLIDPRGEVIGKIGGVGNRMLIDRYVARLLADHRLGGTLAPPRPARARPAPSTAGEGLRYPEGIAAFPPAVGMPGGLCIADTGNDRVLLTGWPDADGIARVSSVLDGQPGLADGVADQVRFSSPRAVSHAAHAGRVFIADTGNHAVRVIDLKTGTARTAAGTGQPGDPDDTGGAMGARQALRSPRGVAVDSKRERVLIAMAGDHRVWSIDLTTMVTRAWAGSGAPGTVDGTLDAARFHQPAGVVLSSDGGRAYVCEGVGCAVREIDLETGRVRTIIGRPGTADEPAEILADAGDLDGEFPAARLRHPAALALWATTPLNAGGDRLLVADTRNGSVRLVDPFRRSVSTWGDRGGLLHPAGIAVGTPRLGDTRPAEVFVAETDAHRIVRYDLSTGRRSEIRLAFD